MISRRLLHCFNRSSKLLNNKNQYRFESLNDTSNLTEDQVLVQQAALNFTKEHLLPFASEWDQKSQSPIEVYKEAGKLGFACIYSSPDHGGSGMDRVSASLVFEALATACVSTSSYLSILNMNHWIIDTYGNEKQKAEWLPQLSTVEKFSSYCLTEPGSGSDAANMKTFAKKDGGDYVINGSKCFISNAGFSDLYVVMCKTGENERSCILVPSDAKGLSFGKPEVKMGWHASPTASITFDNVRVPQSNLISTEGNGFKIAMTALDGGRVNIASTSLGSAAQCLAKTKEYVGQRKQFGKSIDSFQNTQFRIAEMATDLIASRLLVREAAKKIDLNHPNKTLYASMAKIQATEKCYNIVDQCLQLHGGYGYISEYNIERHLRDLRVNRILEGTNEIMRLIVSRQVIKQ
ncbi:acyl-CoA dehydrogenase (macronuclear) [Tetrahymena thermophila SB210]|uniref:Isobutyryl-CoA dehydrogenase, mitochondrial n=1 Tax=Tetrahymena thermophila (strain SB210) TaxID=312017 RepID=I7MGG8_TETTS|nr:acyl-CoA dehydrogenase [Tetrahymena thermophila SB210]EAS01437.1 acyl-CoA dehydrogenase [Tetrahymena thermophila SB210]|eukprot:XP_001021683.1 acyl-CoA dehydrogenase [Tetrahymena thermophila SB210]